MPSFFAKVRAVLAELKRRHVFRVAVVYAVVTWMIIDPASTIIPNIVGEKLGNAIVAIVILLAIFGFPIALVLAWAYETTPGGIRREQPGEEFQIEIPAGSRTHEEGSNEAQTSLVSALVVVFGTLCGVFLLGTWIAWQLFGGSGGIGKGGEGMASDKPIVAVNPFEMASQGEDDSRYSAVWMTEAILRGLRTVDEVMVSTPYRNSGDGAAWGITNSSSTRPDLLITGTLLQETGLQEKTDVGIVLRQAPNLRHEQWATNYVFAGPMEVEDISTIQRDLVREVAQRLGLEFTASAEREIEEKPTDDFRALKADLTAAYDSGRFWWDRRNIHDIYQSIKFFERAIELDQNFAKAYSGLADSYILLAYLGAEPPKEAYKKAEEYANRSLEINGGSAEAFNALAYVHFAYHWDWETAEMYFRKALELDDRYHTAHHWYGWYLTVMGESEKGIAQVQRAIELEELTPILHVDKGWCHYFADQWGEAVGAYQEALKLDPEFAMAHTGLGLVHVERREYDKAIEALQKAVDLSERSAFNLSALGYAYATAGKIEQAMQIMEELKELRDKPDKYLPAAFIAKIYAGLEKPEEALHWLEKAYESRSEYLTTLRVDPAYDRIRDHPDFQALTDRVGAAGLPQIKQ